MPSKPLSHAQRQGRTLSDCSYDRTPRQADPALAQAKQLRSSARWRRVRALKLAEAPLCEDPFRFHLQDGVIVAASQVHHKQGLITAPDLAFALENLASICPGCHRRVEALERQGQTTQLLFAQGEITLVAGPPGSGKSTYVRRHQRPGDLVVDWDLLIGALAGQPGEARHLSQRQTILPYASIARDAVIAALAAEGMRGANAWVIAMVPRAEERQALRERLHAQTVVLAVPLAVCQQRIQGDTQRGHVLDQWIPRIQHWWEAYTPLPGEEERRG